MANGNQLPDDLLQEPVVQALMAGSPPAASANLATAADSPIGQKVAQNKEALAQAGFGFYRSQDGNLGVVFNGLRINPQEIVQADQQGQLLQVAPPFEQIEQEIAGLPPDQNPVLNAQDPGGAAVAAPQPPGGGGGAVPQQGGAVARALLGDRRQALQQGGPTSGPKPGGGRVANAIMQPVV